MLALMLTLCPLVVKPVIHRRCRQVCQWQHHRGATSCHVVVPCLSRYSAKPLELNSVRWCHYWLQCSLFCVYLTSFRDLLWNCVHITVPLSWLSLSSRCLEVPSARQFGTVCHQLSTIGYWSAVMWTQPIVVLNTVAVASRTVCNSLPDY